MSRADWGARAASTSTNITPAGVAVHWEGPRMGSFGHASCPGRVRGIQAFHMDTRGWADIAYSAVACPHGSVFEGRGRGRRTAANGTNDGNQRFYAVCFLGGEGDAFTPEGRQAVNDAIDWLGGGEVVGHRDLAATACPGDEIYAWAHGGRPGAPPAPPAPPTPQEAPVMAMDFTYIALKEDRVFSATARFHGRLPFGDTLDGLRGAVLVDLGKRSEEFHRGVEALADACGFAGDR